MLETYYKEQAEEETATNIVNKYYWQTLEDKGIVAVSRPEINQEGLKEDTDFSFSASFETEPEFEPKGYKGIKLEKEEIQVTDSDMEKRLNEIREMFATMEEIKDDRPVVNADFVMIDFAGSLNGELSKELKAEDYLLEIGSQRFVPGFEEQLIGMKNGEIKAINVVFPADYHENKFAGKEIIFNVTLKSIKEKKLPEIDDNFIKNFDRYNSLEDLKNDVRKTLEEKFHRQAEINLQNRITEILIKENDFEVPSSLVERQIYYMMDDTQKRMVSAGMDEKNAMELSFKMHDKFKDDAAKNRQIFFTFKKDSRKRVIYRRRKRYRKIYSGISCSEWPGLRIIKKMYDSEERKDSLKMELIQKKVFDFIEHNANIKTVENNGMNAEVK